MRVIFESVDHTDAIFYQNEVTLVETTACQSWLVF